MTDVNMNFIADRLEAIDELVVSAAEWVEVVEDRNNEAITSGRTAERELRQARDILSSLRETQSNLRALVTVARLEESS